VPSFLEVLFKMLKKKIILSTLFNNRLFTMLWFKMMKQHVGLSLLQRSLPETQPVAAEALPPHRQLRWICCAASCHPGSLAVSSAKE